MSHIQHIVCAKNTLDKKYYGDIFKLMNLSFDIADDVILSTISQRDENHLFFDTETDELVGIVGVQWFNYEDFCVMYIGNSVVKYEYQHCGLLTTAVSHAMIKTYCKFPFCTKYFASLATTPDAYQYTVRFADSWPRVDVPLPQNVRDVMTTFCNDFCGDNYLANDECFIATNVKSILKVKQPLKQQVIAPKVLSWFLSHNPEYLDGDQVVCMGLIDLAFINEMTHKKLKKCLYTLLNKRSYK